MPSGKSTPVSFRHQARPFLNLVFPPRTGLLLRNKWWSRSRRKGAVQLQRRFMGRTPRAIFAPPAPELAPLSPCALASWSAVGEG